VWKNLHCEETLRVIERASAISTSDPSRMRGAFRLGALRPIIAATAWIAPNAYVVGNVVLKEYSSVWFGVTARGDNPEPITIGKRTNIQDGTVLHADAGVPLTIGDDVTVGHQAMLHGW
jgi:carbonic anhydrase/acetyltransferase-like protein (isoleucine patch superfamily)